MISREDAIRTVEHYARLSPTMPISTMRRRGRPRRCPRCRPCRRLPPTPCRGGASITGTRISARSHGPEGLMASAGVTVAPRSDVRFVDAAMVPTLARQICADLANLRLDPVVAGLCCDRDLGEVRARAGRGRRGLAAPDQLRRPARADARDLVRDRRRPRHDDPLRDRRPAARAPAQPGCRRAAAEDDRRRARRLLLRAEHAAAPVSGRWGSPSPACRRGSCAT